MKTAVLTIAVILSTVLFYFTNYVVGYAWGKYMLDTHWGVLIVLLNTTTWLSVICFVRKLAQSYREESLK